MQRVTVGGQRKDIGLGGFPEVLLAQAREKARATKQTIKDGKAPILQKKDSMSKR